MQMKKDEKGITLLILVITVIVLILITVPIAVNTSQVSELQRYTYFKGDIDKLRESIETVYIGTNHVSMFGPEYTGSTTFLLGKQNGKEVKNPNDNSKYYKIDLNKLNSYIDAQIELQYGEGNKNIETETDDVYIINEQTRTIYYVKGVKYKNLTYHRLGEDFTKLSSMCVVAYDANGGINAPEMQTVEANTTITIGVAPEKGTGFIGWQIEGTDSIYQPGDNYTVTKSIKFIAKWN